MSVAAAPVRRGWIVPIAVLLAAIVGLQAMRDRGRPPFVPPEGMLWIRSGAAMKRLALGYDALIADLYWMRAVVYYGGQRLAAPGARRYDLLYPMLELVTSLDPRFTVAYRFGAIFLTEAFPDGPGRPDLSIALLERGLEQAGPRWEFMHDIGFVYYWWLQDYAKAAEWFNRAGQAPDAPTWLAPLAATTLAVGGDRGSSRLLWEQLRNTSEIDWIRQNAEHRLRQLDALDVIEKLNDVAARYAAREGRPAPNWETLIRAERLRGIPLDPTGVPYEIDPATGRIVLGPTSSLAPLPTTQRSPAPSRPAARPPS